MSQSDVALSFDLSEGDSMNTKPMKFALSIIAILFFTAPVVALAQQPQGNLAEMWLIHLKADQTEEFWTSFKEHVEFRTEQGDPRIWQVYTPLLGDDLGRVAVRHCCVTWEDLDALRKWDEENTDVSDHFNQNVAPHAETYEHYFESMDFANSNWNNSAGHFKYYAVTEFDIKTGSGADFDAARDKMSQIALNQGWASDDRLWLWSTTIGGKPREAVIIPHRNFAHMDVGEESFYEFLGKKMGSDEAVAELMQQFTGATWSSNFQIWEHQAEASMSDAN
jgi:hypothetical protein